MNGQRWGNERAAIQYYLQGNTHPLYPCGCAGEKAGHRHPLTLNIKGDILVSMDTIQDTLKKAISDSGLSGYELERQTGVNRLSIGRFMRGITGLSMEQAQMLADYFGLALLPVKAKRTRKGTK